MIFRSYGQRHEIVVRDNGEGNPDEMKDQVLIPFYSTKPKGSGIGLSLARQIVQLHVGQLSFENHKNGCSFYIKL